MKNYFLTFALAVSVVAAGVSLRQKVAGIGSSPVPPSAQSVLGIGSSPVPPSAQNALGIGSSPVPPSAQSQAVEISRTR
jgi:hypothetical protein